MIISISGKAGSGKDLVGTIIQILTKYPEKDDASILLLSTGNNGEKFTQEDSCWEIKKFADKLKQIVCLTTGCQMYELESQSFKEKLLPEQWLVKYPDLTYRKYLQMLGTDVFRNIFYEGVWEYALLVHYSSKSKWIVTDTRFPNELEAVKNKGGITIKILRDFKNNTEELHESETALDFEKFDYIINNNESILELIKKIRTILKKENIIK
jgi:dephospho-CoA kinase